MENTLTAIMSEKEEANAKIDERRHREKEEQMLSLTDIQRKTLEAYERKLTEGKERSRAKKIELKKEVEATLLVEESRIRMDDLTFLDLERRT
jgi:hypothetical protein